MNLKKIFFPTLFILLGSAGCFSQSYPAFYYHDIEIDSTDTNKLFLQIDNANFFKNNEYFGDIAEGYSLLGFRLTPKFTYIPNKNIKLSAGTQVLSYYGRENEIEAALLLSFQYQFHQNISLTLGNIDGTLNHRLIEPLFDYERYLNKNIENGIQFLWNSERIFADLWLHWEQQIFQDDPFQEKFNLGLSADYTIFEQQDYSISIPFQNLIRHEGGQINSNNEEPLVTIFNNATGLSLKRHFTEKFIHSLKFSTYVANYQDLSPNKQQMFIDGTASYTTIELYNNHFNFLVGYWYGKQFVAPLGNPLFETYSRTKFFVEEPVRQLLTAKLNYHKNIYNGIYMDVRFEPYFDLINGYLEYNFGLVIIFKESFFLKNMK
ncbi:MAG: hypothetical protein R6V23_08325 [Bacteroidales bacterium]